MLIKSATLAVCPDPAQQKYQGQIFVFFKVGVLNIQIIGLKNRRQMESENVQNYMNYD